MLMETVKPPPVFISKSQLAALEDILAKGAGPPAELLRDELARAKIVDDRGRGAAFVRLGGRVRYRDLVSGRERTVELVAPEEADMDAGRLSLLTPAGAALLGLRAGAAFEWIDDQDRLRGVKVLEVDAS